MWLLMSANVIYAKPSKSTKDEEKESHLPKWAKDAHSANNITSDVEASVKTMHQIQKTLNYMCFTSTIFF